MKFFVDNENYVTLEDVEKLVGLKESSIYMRVRFGHFPEPRKFEIRQAWKLSEIEEYIQNNKK
ncbi:MAG: AlpA family phage regulatory protein [Holosporaceae bacterium]|jgi:predicted DNA-binding transcriptional regulator AlpA|nr:AlpA family phage regulatory protein [Holosporaceae bacterium]